MSECTNCSGPGGESLSFDLDLPSVVLCGWCSLLIVTDREMFDEVGGRGRSKRQKPMHAGGPVTAADDTTPDDLRQVRERAFADGRLAGFADTADLTPILANRSGMADPAGELVAIASDTDNNTARGRLLDLADAIRGETRSKGDDRG